MGGAAGRRGGFDCFAEPATDELLAGGRKVAGSAQRRAGGAVLQHGSIRLAPDPPAAAAAAGLDPDRATSLAELGGTPDPARAAKAVAEGFAAVLAPLGVSLVPGALSATERDGALRRGEDPVREALASS